MLHIKTPLLESLPLSRAAGLPVYIKLENTQPSSSFKIRGIGNMCLKAKERGCTHIVSSSGGNAGLAAAYAARKLGMKAKVVVPESTVQRTVDALRAEGAEVEVFGRLWEDANRRAVALAETPGCALIHPYDHPDIWAGHSTIVDELHDELKVKPAAVVVSVGGGGLACGVIEGLHRVGWSDVPLVAMETEGAASLNAAVKAGTVVTIPDITSIAKSLGARSICQRLFDYLSTHNVKSHVVTDVDAVNACLRFADWARSTQRTRVSSGTPDGCSPLQTAPPHIQLSAPSRAASGSHPFRADAGRLSAASISRASRRSRAAVRPPSTSLFTSTRALRHRKRFPMGGAARTTSAG